MTSFMGRDDRLLQLLADEATEGLSGSQFYELEQEIQARPDVPRNGIELAAAAAALAMMGGTPERLPHRMRARLLADAALFMAHPQRTSGETPTRVDSAPESPGNVRLANRSSRAAWLVAAASMVFAVVGWRQGPAPTQEAPVQVRYEQFVQRASDLVQGPWVAKVDNYRGVSGRVVWSDAEQAGYLVFTGLPANARHRQYQVWIVDPQRDPHPVDGGVFDVPPVRGPITIPMHAHLPVRHPVVFAITLEKEGGVVVSDGPLLVVASIAK